MPKKGKPELKVVFDTSALFTSSASNLFNSNIENLIKDYLIVPDLKITWHLPSIVSQEREFQMLKEGKKLLPSIQKLEKLLGHNLNITEKIVHSSIKATIKQYLEEYSINVIEPDIKCINWQQVVQKSLWRVPPFEDSEKEKGFRDELIQQTFLQVINNSPKTPSICRVVFLGHDSLLLSSLAEATKGLSNVKIFSDLEELKGLINTLVSQVKEELIEAISEDISKLFFEKDDKESLYYKEKVSALIVDKYKAHLQELAQGSEKRSNGTWFISHPRFFSKKGQRITWKTRINVVSKSYKFVKNDAPITHVNPFQTALGKTVPNYYNPSSGYVPSMNLFSPNDFSQTLLGGASATGYSNLLDSKEELVANGRTTFEVTWSVTVATNHKLRNPKVDSIDFIEINWNDSLE